MQNPACRARGLRRGDGQSGDRAQTLHALICDPLASIVSGQRSFAVYMQPISTATLYTLPQLHQQVAHNLFSGAERQIVAKQRRLLVCQAAAPNGATHAHRTPSGVKSLRLYGLKAKETRHGSPPVPGLSEGPTPCQGLGFASVWDISKGDHRRAESLRFSRRPVNAGHPTFPTQNGRPHFSHRCLCLP